MVWFGSARKSSLAVLTHASKFRFKSNKKKKEEGRVFLSSYLVLVIDLVWEPLGSQDDRL